MRFLILTIILITSIGVLSKCTSRKEFDPKDIPIHQMFIKKKIEWQTSLYEDSTYMKAIGQREIDTMVIVTRDKLIIISGQYGLKPGDTVIMPYSGEFGIAYEVVRSDKHDHLKDATIKIGGQSFIPTSKAKFEWWPEIIHKLDKVGKGKVIVSGP
jgi:hypothetical protein